MQKTRTFYPPTNNENFLLSQLSKNTEEVCAKARHYMLVPKSISFFLKSQSFRYFDYSIKLPAPANTPEILISLIDSNFKKIYERGVLYRSTGVTLSELVPSSASQLNLFGETEFSGKLEKIHEQIDSLEDKFGRGVVYLASTHEAIKDKRKGTDMDDEDRNLLFL